MLGDVNREPAGSGSNTFTYTFENPEIYDVHVLVTDARGTIDVAHTTIRLNPLYPGDEQSTTNETAAVTPPPTTGGETTTTPEPPDTLAQ